MMSRLLKGLNTIRPQRYNDTYKSINKIDKNLKINLNPIQKLPIIALFCDGSGIGASLGRVFLISPTLIAVTESGHAKARPYCAKSDKSVV
jgi:hypothetical protein